MNNNFFDKSGLEALDQQIEEHMSRPTLVGRLKKGQKRKIEGQLDWAAELSKYWYVYIFLVVSAVFTGTLGGYMGLAPYPTETGLYFQTDAPHIFLAMVYVVAFITVTEVAFALSKRLFFTREENNNAQKFSMLVMMFVSGISIFGTGLAGGMVIASNIDFMSEFTAVPAAAQKWVVAAIPALITTYTILVTIYHLSSDSAASERITREQIREQELDNQTRQRAIETIAAEQLSKAELLRYMVLVEEGKISAADAKAAMRAGRTLGQEEIRRGKDIDGYGGIGVTRPLPVTQMAAETRSPNGSDPTPPSHRNQG